LKILQVIDTLGVGGAEKVLVTLANLQYKYKDQVAVLTLLEPGELAPALNPAIPKWSLHRKWKYNPLTMYRFVQIAKKFDVIHVHSRHNMRYVYLASLVFALKNRVVFHEHFGDIETDTSVKWHQRLIYPKLYYVGVSEKLCAWAKSKVGVPDEQVFLLSNTVASYPLVLNQKKEKPEALKIVIVGNIRRPKNIVFAIKLLKQIENYNSPTLTIIGKIKDEHYFKELLALVENLGLVGKVIFEHECNNVQLILPNFDVAIHPAHSESGPLVLIEYLGQGIPFLAHDVGEVTKIVKNKYPEYVIDTLELNAWKEKLSEVLDSTSEERKKELRQFYEENFSEQTYYQKCRSIYAKVLHS